MAIATAIYPYRRDSSFLERFEIGVGGYPPMWHRCTADESDR